MYDVIVVGARCAGSPTAMLLARMGHRVLLVDRATFPSDTASTHYVQQPAVARLRDWGLLDEVDSHRLPAGRDLRPRLRRLRTPRSSHAVRRRRSRVRTAPHPARRDPRRRRGRRRRDRREWFHRRRPPVGRRGRRRHQRPHRERQRSARARPPRRRRRRLAQCRRQGCRRHRVRRPRRQAVRLLHVLERPADDRDGRLHPGDHRRGRDPDQRRAHVHARGAGRWRSSPRCAPTSKSTTSRCSTRRRSPTRSAPRPAKTGGTALLRYRTSSAGRTARAGPSSGTRATTRTPSPRTGSRTPSGMPSCSRRPPTGDYAEKPRCRTHSPSTTTGATRRPGRCSS